jgi:hypothetical protein
MDYSVNTCNGCGRDLSDIIPNKCGIKKCPDCEATESNNFRGIEEKAVSNGFTLNVIIKDEYGHRKREIKQRPDVSADTKKPVRVTTDRNRGHPKYLKMTTLTHTVESIDPLTGYATKIHEDLKKGSTRLNPNKK